VKLTVVGAGGFRTPAIYRALVGDASGSVDAITGDTTSPARVEFPLDFDRRHSLTVILQARVPESTLWDNRQAFNNLNGPASRLIRQAPRLLMSGAGSLDRASVLGSPRGHQPMLGTRSGLPSPLRVTPCSPAG
jgi:hypothetical protein